MLRRESAHQHRAGLRVRTCRMGPHALNHPFTDQKLECPRSTPPVVSAFIGGQRAQSLARQAGRR